MAVVRTAALLAVCLVGPFYMVVVVSANPMATEYTSSGVDLEGYDPESDDLDAGGDAKTEHPETKPTQLDPWSLVWYIGSFGGLVAFFLAVSCSECCCHRPQAAPGGASAAGGSSSAVDAAVELPPPPPYSLFAPPPYDSLVYAAPLQEKDRLAVFVVPVPVHGVVSHPP